MADTTNSPHIQPAVDQRADVLAVQFASSFTPIQDYCEAVYGNSFGYLHHTQRIAALTVAVHAVQHSTFPVPHDRRRVAYQAFQLAQQCLLNEDTGGPAPRFRKVYARLVGSLAAGFADTFED